MRNTNYRWYGARVLGDAEARRRWSNAVGVELLHDISTLRQEVSALSIPSVQRLIELKGMPASDNPVARARQLQGVVDEFITRMTALLRGRAPVLADLHLPLDACIRLLGIAIERFAKQGLTEGEWDVPDGVAPSFRMTCGCISGLARRPIVRPRAPG